MKQAMTVFLIAIMIFLSGCSKKKDINEIDQIFNMEVNRMASENLNSIFYISSQQRIQIVAQNSANGDKQNAIKNPFIDMFDIGTSFYVYDNHLYYIKQEKTYSQAGAKPSRTSIIEIDLDTYEEKPIYEADTNWNKNAFLGTINTPVDTASYSDITGFFLDDENLYLIESNSGGAELKEVNRKTGKTETLINSSDNLNQLSYDGNYIYYITPRFQIMRIDLKTKEKIIIPNLITKYMILTNKQLLFLNPRDNCRIYAMDLDDFSQKKITENTAYTFHCDDRYIYYANEDDHNYLYRIDFEGKNNKKVAEIASYNIVVFQNHTVLNVRSDKGTYVVDKNTFETNILE